MDIDVYLDRTIKYLGGHKTLVCEIGSVERLPAPRNRATWKATIWFYDGSVLHMSQTVETGHSYPQYLAYSYQYMADGLPVFRYDDSPYHRGLDSHKHVGHTVVASAPPSAQDLIHEVLLLIAAKNIAPQD